MIRTLFCELIGVIIAAAVPTLSAQAQSVLHYTFQPGEQLQYHYKVDANFNVMRRWGGRELETVFEADPQWNIEDVSMEGGARAILTVLHRSETYVNGHWTLGFLHFTPQSELALDAKGNLLYAKILVDDTERTRTKQIVDRVPGIHLASDENALRPYFERLWYMVDTTSVDTLGTPFTKSFDSVLSRPFEHDTMVYGRLDTFLTALVFPTQIRGKTTYTLRDTIVYGHHFWILRSVMDEESINIRNPKLRSNESHRVTDILFRKEDGIIQAWHYTLENHNGSVSSNSEMWLTLTSIDEK